MADRDGLVPGDEAPPSEPSAAENTCPDCSGTGEIDGSACANCEGSGTVFEAVGGG